MIKTYVTEDQVEVDIFVGDERTVLRIHDLTDPASPGWAMHLTPIDRAELASLLLVSPL